MGEVINLAEVIAARKKRERKVIPITEHPSYELIPHVEFPDYVGSHFNRCSIDIEVEKFYTELYKKD